MSLITNIKFNLIKLNYRSLVPQATYTLNYYSSLRKPGIFLEDSYLKRARKLRQRSKNVRLEGETIEVIDTVSDHGKTLSKTQSNVVATLAHGTLSIVRQIEMMNVFLGFEQANRYIIYDDMGQVVGYLAEEVSFFSTIQRQILRTHRPFQAFILDPRGEVVLKVNRPFWLINSQIFISTSDDKVIGEVQKEWHLWRRRYNLFVGLTQFARIDAPFLSWDFELRDEEEGLLAFISRNFRGFAREIFTDTGHYALVMDSLPNSKRSLTLDERAVALATAITLDFDYFSRHSSAGSGWFPFIGFGSGE